MRKHAIEKRLQGKLKKKEEDKEKKLAEKVQAAQKGTHVGGPIVTYGILDPVSIVHMSDPTMSIADLLKDPMYKETTRKGFQVWGIDVDKVDWESVALSPTIGTSSSIRQWLDMPHSTLPNISYRAPEGFTRENLLVQLKVGNERYESLQTQYYELLASSAAEPPLRQASSSISAPLENLDLNERLTRLEEKMETMALENRAWKEENLVWKEENLVWKEENRVWKEENKRLGTRIQTLETWVKNLKSLLLPGINAAAKSLLENERNRLIAQTQRSPANESKNTFYGRLEEALKKEDKALYQRWNTVSQFYEELSSVVHEASERQALNAISFFQGDRRALLEELFEKDYNKPFCYEGEEPRLYSYWIIFLFAFYKNSDQYLESCRENTNQGLPIPCSLTMNRQILKAATMS